MSATFTIPTIFTAVDKFSSPVHKMSMTMESFSSKADATIARSERMFRKLTPAISEASKQMLSMVGTAAIVGGALALGTSSIKSIMDYETAIQSLQAVTGVRNNELFFFKSEISSLATSSRKSAVDVAKSFEVIGSAMSQYLSDPKALRSISEAGITLSKASRMELEPTLQALTSVMNQFGLEAGMANDTINRLTAGEIVGSISTSKISEYLQEFGASAKLANINVGESVALIEALGIQMSHDKIAVGARNLLTVLDSAKGLDKAALASLSKAGVSTELLMDKSKSLGERLRELSKIKDDAVGITKVFGKENKTAAQVIFAQLDKYDEFERKIQKTNKAQEQAGINSNTLANRLDELKNSWTNMLTSSNSATNGLNIAKKAIQFITKNLSTIVAVAGAVISFFVLWKTVLIASRVAMVLYNVAFGIHNALTKGSIFLTEGNIVAKYADLVATKLITGATWLWNAAMSANPIFLIIAGVAALSLGVYALTKAFKTTTAAERVSTQVRERALENTIDQRVEITMLFQALRKAEQGTSAYKDVLEKINAIQPGLVDKYNLQAKAVQNINAAERELIGTIMKRAEVEARAELLREKTKQLIIQQAEGPSFFNKLLGGFGAYGEMNARILQAEDDAKIQDEINVLASQMYSDTPAVNPKAEQQKSMEQTLIKNNTTTNKEKLSIEVIGLPDWMRVRGGNSLESIMPATTSTMKK